MEYNELTNNQLRVAQDSKQVFLAYTQTKSLLLKYQGGMFWKTVAGTDYLIKVTNRRGGNRSIGPRSTATETIYEEFYAGKARLAERYDSLNRSMLELSGMSKGVGINRVPNIVTATLRELDEVGLLGESLQVIGTNAIYAYESAAGVQFDIGLLATMDVDFLWDSRAKLKLGVKDEKVIRQGLLSVLRKVDKSFDMSRQPYRAVNKDGFYVDLVMPVPRASEFLNPSLQIAQDDLRPAELINIKWLMSSEKFLSTVIGQDGMPAPMVAPDPRAFSIYKLWLSEQSEREPEKKGRDKAQALAVAKLVKDKFPHLKWDNKVIRMFPKKVSALFDDYNN